MSSFAVLSNRSMQRTGRELRCEADRGAAAYAAGLGYYGAVTKSNLAPATHP
jgi:hypothetical protein